MRFIEHPDVARLNANPYGPQNLLGAQPGEFCTPPCPGKICCANGLCVSSVSQCLGYAARQPPARYQRRRLRGSRSLRRNNPRTVADRVLGIFGLHPRG